MIKKVKLYVNTTKESAVAIASQVSEALLEEGYDIVDYDADLVIGFGGDGTLLRWINSNGCHIRHNDTKYIGVNCGTLGFMQDFDVEDAKRFVKNIPSYIEKRLYFIEMEFVADGKKHIGIYALNDFSILNGEDKTFRADVSISYELLETYVGTGLVIATPTGSTARSLSSGGSIMFPELQAMQMTPIEPIVNSKIHCMPKSICIPKGRCVCLTPTNQDNVKIMSDGICMYNGKYEEIVIKFSDYYMTVLTDKKHSFVRKIREKLI